MRAELLRFNGAVERDPAIDAWMKEHAGELGAIAHQWFEVMRKCGDEVRELLHDGCPVACLGDAPFGYVNVFHSHVNVGVLSRRSAAGSGSLVVRAPFALHSFQVGCAGRAVSPVRNAGVVYEDVEMIKFPCYRRHRSMHASISLYIELNESRVDVFL
jgi:hypothetical protein